MWVCVRIHLCSSNRSHKLLTTLACCAALVRVLGPDVAEVPVLAVRPDLQGNGLGARLLALLEAGLLAAGVRMVAMPGGAEPDLGGTSSGAGPEAPASLPEAAAAGAAQVRCASLVLVMHTACSTCCMQCNLH